MTDSADTLLERVREAVAGTYDLLGALGHQEHGVPIYLARALATGSLVGVTVKQDDLAGTEFTIEVQRTLGESVAVSDSACPECRTALPDLERFCFHCGADLSGVVTPDGSPESARLLAALSSATAGRYEILGRMDREGTAGTVYFARDLQSRRIVALRMRRALPSDAVQAEYVVNQTAVFRGPVAPPAAVARGAASAPPVYAPPVQAVPMHATPVQSLPVHSTPSYAPVNAAPVHDASMHAASVRSTPAHVPAPHVATHAGANAPPAVDAMGTPVHEGAAAPTNKPAWMRAPSMVGAAVALLAIVGYFAFKDDGAGDVSVPPAPAVVPAAAPATPAPDTTPVAPVPAVASTDSAAKAALATAAVDSGTLRLVGSLPAGARVTIDGRTVRGRSFRLASGSHTFAITAPGYDNYSQRLRVRPGSDEQWAPRLVATVAANSSAPAPEPERPRTSAASCRTAVRAEDWPNAFTLCTNEANAGDIGASSSLARMYARGLGTGRNTTQAFTWYAKAAAGGDRDAQTALGYALRDGVEVRRDAAQSVRWFKAAAEQGDRAAQLEYAVALEKGEGTARDEKTARDFYRKSAEQGNFMAARRLAKMQERGAGGPRSDSDAAVAYERAATLGDAESAMTIARWYRDGRGVAKSKEKALTFFKRAAELGNREADAEMRRLDKGEV